MYETYVSKVLKKIKFMKIYYQFDELQNSAIVQKSQKFKIKIENISLKNLVSRKSFWSGFNLN